LSLNATARTDGLGDNVPDPIAAAPGSRYSTIARTTGVAIKAFCAWTRVHATARKISGTRTLGPTFGGAFGIRSRHQIRVRGWSSRL